MKVESKKTLFVAITPVQAAAINGGRHGADDGSNHDLFEDRNDDRKLGRRNDDPKPHF
jgi:hypothetical protein